MSDSTKELENFKQDIRSYLTALPDGISVRDIERDFYGFMETRLPYRNLGFCDAMDLLKAVPDAVKLDYRGNDLRAYAVCVAETLHVAKMVSRQKKSGSGYPSTRNRDNRNYGSRNRNPPPPRMNQIRSTKQIISHYIDIPKSVPGNIKENVQQLLEKYPNGLNVDNFKLAFRKEYGFDINSQDFNFVRLNDFLRALAKEQILEMYEESNNYFVQLPQRLQLGPSKLKHKGVERNEEKKENNNVTLATEPQRNLDSWGGDSYIDKHVLKNLKELIIHFPHGIPITDLCEKYKEYFRCDLDLWNLGYNNVQELVNDLGDIVHIRILSDGECILMDPQLSADQEATELPDNASNEEILLEEEIPLKIELHIFDLLSYFTDGILLSEFESIYKTNYNRNIPWQKLGFNSLERFLLSLKLDPPICIKQCGIEEYKVMLEPNGVIPDDAVVLGQGYTSLQTPDDDGYFPVCVGQVVSPGKIWLQRISETEYKNLELEDLMDNLEDFYVSREADKYQVPDKYLMAGLNCAVLYPEENNWHRGSIIGKPGPVSYKVFYYDYGTVHVVEKNEIRLLKQCFAKLPAQAFCTRLANVKPLDSFFSQEATLRLLNLSFNKPLMAKVTSSTYMNTLSVILCDTSEEDDIFLNDVLVFEELVLPCRDYLELRQPQNTSHLESVEQVSVDVPLESAVPPPTILNQMQTQDASNSFTLFNLNPIGNPSIDSSPPNQTDGQHRKLLDPEILMRAIERRKLLNFSSRENANVATVGPLQHFVAKSPDMPNLEIPLATNHSLESEIQVSSPNSARNQETEVYESSEDDEKVPTQGKPATTGSCAKMCNPLRFCKAVAVGNGAYSVHLVNFFGLPCFTSSDVSSFIFGVDIVKRLLDIQKYPKCHIVATRSEHQSLIEELENCGVSSDETRIEKVFLYLLSDVVKILPFLKFDKLDIIAELESLSLHFNAEDEYWKTKPVFENLDGAELENQLAKLREQRKVLLASMLDEESSSFSKTQSLVSINKEMEELKSRLSNCNQQSPKSASEQARIFLERVKLSSQPEQRTDDVVWSAPTPMEEEMPIPAISGQHQVFQTNFVPDSQVRSAPSPLEEVTAVPATSGRPRVSKTNFVHSPPQNSVAIATDQTNSLFVMSMGHPRFPAAVPTMMTTPINPLMPVGIPQFYSGGYYPRMNLPLPSSGLDFRFTTNNMNFMPPWQ